MTATLLKPQSWLATGGLTIGYSLGEIEYRRNHHLPTRVTER